MCKAYIKCAVETRLPTSFGEFMFRAYENEIDGLAHLALLMDGSEGRGGLLVRAC